MENLTPGHHADHARAGIQAAHPEDEETIDWETNTVDLLADLMHLATEEDFSFADALYNARTHYFSETMTPVIGSSTAPRKVEGPNAQNR